MNGLPTNAAEALNGILELWQKWDQDDTICAKDAMNAMRPHIQVLEAEGSKLGRFPENEVHKSIAGYLTKKQQGYIMGTLRNLNMLYNPRDAQYQVKKS